MLATVALPSAPRLVLVNKTGAEQSLIMAAELAPPKSDPDDLAMQLAATTLGGNFVSRLNMNLREDKHWSYGAFASIGRSEEHTSELQSLMRISYAVFCLKQKNANILTTKFLRHNIR